MAAMEGTRNSQTLDILWRQRQQVWTKAWMWAARDSKDVSHNKWKIGTVMTWDRKAEEGTGLGGMFGGSVLDTLSLKCTLDIKIGYAKQTAGSMSMKSGNRCERDIKIWESKANRCDSKLWVWRIPTRVDEHRCRREREQGRSPGEPWGPVTVVKTMRKKQKELEGTAVGMTKTGMRCPEIQGKKHISRRRHDNLCLMLLNDLSRSRSMAILMRRVSVGQKRIRMDLRSKKPKRNWRKWV